VDATPESLKPKDVELQRLIEYRLPDDEVDAATLFVLATRFNDGHNLASIELEGGGLRLDLPHGLELAGDACFYSREVALCSETRRVRAFGSVLRKSLREKDLALAATLVTQEVLHLLNSIQDERLRETIRQLVVLAKAGTPPVPAREGFFISRPRSPP
jgi:hypothetical protein